MAGGSKTTSKYTKLLDSSASKSAVAQANQATIARLAGIKEHLSSETRGTRLKNKVCVVTGAGSLKGIGRASAVLFARESARHLYLADLRNDSLPKLSEYITKTYPDVKVTTVTLDASDEAAISQLCERILNEEGRLDVFFANSGVCTLSSLADITSDDFMKTLRINALSCFVAVKHASKAMLHTNPEKGKPLSSGSIILTASTAGLRSGGGSVDYSASKAAANSIAQTSAFQLHKTGIRVNSICPGLIETDMSSQLFDYARERGAESKLGQLSSLGRYGLPEEVAQAACFLASDDSSYITGQNYAVDGGLSATLPVLPGRWL
jgi:NAD(P)-dependent dehydrogenase (short-subunit alcohol dehydrogenase family)